MNRNPSEEDCERAGHCTSPRDRLTARDLAAMTPTRRDVERSCTSVFPVNVTETDVSPEGAVRPTRTMPSNFSGMAFEGIAKQKRRSEPPMRPRSEGRRGPDKRGFENITKDLSGCRDVLFIDANE